MEAGVSALSFEYKNNSWLSATYFDSLVIAGRITGNWLKALLVIYITVNYRLKNDWHSLFYV